MVNPIGPEALRSAMDLAERLFRDIRTRTADGPGVSREPYSPAEQATLGLLEAAARDLGAEIVTDPVGNQYMTLPGADRAAPGWITGSHVDSVPVGGNYDGLAGVVAGLSALAAMRAAGVVPPVDVTVMGIRAEELSSWYGGSHDGHIGSRAALGQLPAAELDSAINSRTGRTLREHVAAAGFDPGVIATGRSHLPARYRGYLELHIEQGPVLEAKGIPVGVVTAIRGAARARSCRCIGEYTHSGAVPREYRRDAVKAAAELVGALDAEWDRLLAQGNDLVYTVGKFYTDAALHALTKVPGEVQFTLDFRSQDNGLLERLAVETRTRCDEIAARRNVRFELSPFSLHRAAAMDAGLRSAMREGCAAMGIRCMDIPSGAGHDAQDFAHAGIPAAMIFVRNANGSHNAAEAMDMEDFALGTRLLAWTLLNAA